MKDWTYKEQQLMKRHYMSFKIFGKEVWWFNTTPQKVLDHLKEIKRGIIFNHKGKD